MEHRPNIVIFNPDHYRGEAMGHAGNPCVHTPTLDRLAEAEAVSFRRAYCQNPVCTPSRCCFMTGWYPHVRGHRTMCHMLRADEPNLLSRLKDAGYYVWWGGKNDLVPAQYGFGRHCDVKHEPPQETRELPPDWRGDPASDAYFSFFYGKVEKGAGEEVYYDRDWAEVLGALEQIRNLPDDRPFCLYLPLRHPHPPFAVEEPFYSMIDRSKVPRRIPTPESWDGKPSILKGIFENTGMQEWSEERWNEMRALYYGMCSRIDHQLGLVVDALLEAQRFDDTALFFFSDHGMYAGDYGIVDINQNTFEECQVRVPFVVKPPAGAELDAGVCDSLVELTDLVATVEELADLPPTHTHFGRSLVPLLADRQRGHRDAVFCEGGRHHGEHHCMELESRGSSDPSNLYYPRLSLQRSEGPEHTRAAMCRTERFKYVRRRYESDELYDMEADPMELHNLVDAQEYRETLLQLKERMLEWYMNTSDVVPFDPDRRK